MQGSYTLRDTLIETTCCNDKEYFDFDLGFPNT